MTGCSIRRLPSPLLLLATLAACGPGGGELREVTERRRAEGEGADTARDTAASRQAADDRLPAFVDTSAAPAAPVDTAPARAGNPAGQPEWSAERRSAGAAGTAISTLREMRVGNNAGFDRLVLDFGDAPIPAYEVEYVDGPVPQCGSGDPSEVAGNGRLRVRLLSTRAHDDAGRATVRERQIVPSTPVLREIEIVCDFEGQVEVVLGVQTPNPYRVLVVPSPNRLIVDVRQ